MHCNAGQRQQLSALEMKNGRIHELEKSAKEGYTGKVHF